MKVDGFGLHSFHDSDIVLFVQSGSAIYLGLDNVQIGDTDERFSLIVRFDEVEEIRSNRDTSSVALMLSDIGYVGQFERTNEGARFDIEWTLGGTNSIEPVAYDIRCANVSLYRRVSLRAEISPTNAPAKPLEMPEGPIEFQ